MTGPLRRHYRLLSNFFFSLGQAKAIGNCQSTLAFRQPKKISPHLDTFGAKKKEKENPRFLSGGHVFLPLQERKKNFALAHAHMSFAEASNGNS